MKLSVQIEFDKCLDLETPKSSVIVGRAPTNDLVITHDSISRKHCKIDVVKGVFYITDLGSSNGSFIDGQKLQPEVRTPFIGSQQLTLGKLECEITESGAPTDHANAKVVSSKLTNGDATATVRISRLDLNRPAITPEMAKKHKVKGPRNPVTDDGKDDDVEIGRSKKPLIAVIVIALLAAAWFLAPGE